MSGRPKLAVCLHATSGRLAIRARQGIDTLSRPDLIMGKAVDKKRAAAAAPGGNDSDGSGRASMSRRKDLMIAPVQAANKAVVPQQAAAVNASVNAAGKETSKDKPIGQYDSFELQIKRITQGKPSKTVPTLAASPSKFNSPGRAPKTNKVWVAGLKSGEMIAYVTDRTNPEAPAFIKDGMGKLREDPQLCEKAMVSEFIQKKAGKEPFKAWALPKVNQTTKSAYTLYWHVLLRRFDNLADHTPQARIAWGESLAKFFAVTDMPNKFEYGGDLSKDKACPASAFFTVQDVMEKLIKKRLDGVLSESEIVQNEYLMDCYYGDDSVLNGQVTQFYMPNEQSETGGEQEEANKNKELFDLF